MNFKDLSVREKAGTLLLAGCIIQFFGMQIAEYVYPGYSVSHNFISDLGGHNLTSALLFNITLFIFGASVIIAFYWMKKDGMDKIFCYLLMLAGLGAIIVSIFNENTILAIHYTGAFMAFCLTAFAAMRSYGTIFKGRIQGKFSLVLGIIGFAAAIGQLTTQNVNDFLGLGPGGMERMLYYPAVLFAIMVGVYLLNSKER
ncbi:MAG: DUF998 domain-containing protein [Methanomassiliicoccales archaeon]